MQKQCWFAWICVVLCLLIVSCGGEDTPLPAAPTAAPTATEESVGDTPEPDPVQPETAEEPTAVPTEAPPTAVPTPAGPQASVVDIINIVNAHPLPAGEWETAWIDMTIFMGGEVWAEEESTARVGLLEGMIRVAPNTIFTFGQPEPDTITLNLQEGQVWLNVEGLDEDTSFEVETPNAVASVRGTRFSVRSYPDEGTLVSTQVGTVTLGVDNQLVTVTTGFESTAPLMAEPSQAITISTQEELRWGMAAGHGLDVVLPTGQSVYTVAMDGLLSDPQLSPDGTYFSALNYNSLGMDSTYEKGGIIYELQSGQTITSMVPASATGIHFSPAGEWIGYQEYVDGGYQICTVNHTETISNCFGGDAFYGWPYWSPDGQWLAFYSDRDGSTTNIYRARLDGSELTALTTGSDSVKDGPEWSPDGTKIAYIDKPTDYEQPGDLWVMNADGSDPQFLKDGVYRYQHPKWTPDGSAVVVRGFKGGLYLVPMDGEAPEVIPGTEEWPCYDPQWAASATGWPLYFHYVDPDNHRHNMYYVLDKNTPPVSLVRSVNWGPVWSADGRWAAFGSVDMSGEVPRTTIYLFPMVPGFYP